jgi:hypothetical protein
MATVQTPVAIATVTRPAITWTSVPWAQTYAVWIDDLTAGVSQAFYVNGLTTTTWTPTTNLTSGHTYRTWVQAVGEGGVALWSAYHDFTESLPAPVVQAPGATVTTPTTTVAWTGVSWAQTYNVWVDDVTAGVSRALYVSGLTGTTWTTTDLTNLHVYRVWVQGVGSGSAVWSGSQDFNVALPAPTLQTPATSTTDRTPTFTWTGVPWATSYAVWVNDLTTGQGQVLYVASVTTTTWTATSALTAGHRYRWWVEANSSDNALWSVAQDFTET